MVTEGFLVDAVESSDAVVSQRTAFSDVVKLIGWRRSMLWNAYVNRIALSDPDRLWCTDVVEFL